MATSWDWQLLGCFEKGAHAYFDKVEKCPYVGHRGLNRQRAEYWRDGWKAAKEGRFIDERRNLREMSN